MNAFLVPMEHVQAALKRKDIQDLISVRVQGGLTENVVLCPVSNTYLSKSIWQQRTYELSVFRYVAPDSKRLTGDHTGLCEETARYREMRLCLKKVVVVFA